MFNKITNKIDQNELMIQMQDWILDQISNMRLAFDIKLYNRTELINNILSPSKIRYDIIERVINKYFLIFILKIILESIFLC